MFRSSVKSVILFVLLFNGIWFMSIAAARPGGQNWQATLGGGICLGVFTAIIYCGKEK